MVRSAHEKSPRFYVGLFVWFLLCIVLMVYDLGVLAFVGSVFVAMGAWGLREKFESETTASAYSVFNTNGQAIVGGFTMDQLDRQLRGGGIMVNKNDDTTTAGIAQAAATNRTTTTNSVTEQERLRRRRDAAAAADRRAKMT